MTSIIIYYIYIQLNLVYDSEYTYVHTYTYLHSFFVYVITLDDFKNMCVFSYFLLHTYTYIEARVLNPPTNLRIVSINEDTNSVAFAWNPPHDKSRGHTKFYLQLQLGPVTNVKFVSQHFVPFSTHNYTFNNLRAGVEYILDVFSYALDGSTEILSDTSETPRVIFYINIGKLAS